MAIKTFKQFLNEGKTNFYPIPDAIFKQLQKELPYTDPENFALTDWDIKMNTPTPRETAEGKTFRDIYYFTTRWGTTPDVLKYDTWWCRITKTGKVKAHSCRKSSQDTTGD